MAKQYSIIIFLLAVTAFAGSSKENEKPSKPSSKRRKEPQAKPTQAKPKKTRARETKTNVPLLEPRALESEKGTEESDGFTPLPEPRASKPGESPGFTPLPEPRALQPGESPVFRNLGNTCFMNSALQSLYAVKSFWRKLKAWSRKREKEEKPVRAWVELLYKFKADSWTTTIASPNEIQNKMREDMELNRGGMQEDAQEFLMQLIQPRTTPSNNPSLRLPDTLWNLFDTGNPSALIPDNLVIPADEADHTLEELLNEAHNSVQNSMLRSAPDILIFSLGIFHREYTPRQRTYKKVNKIDISEKLNMKPYIQGEESDQFYYLRSVIYHSGSTPDSGHYYAHVRENGKWVEKNDTPLRSIELPEQTKPTAHKGKDIPYILFYEKRITTRRTIRVNNPDSACEQQQML